MTHAFRTAVEQRDETALLALLAPDVRLNSPVAFRPFVGRDAVAHVLRNVLEVFEDFEYIAELTSDEAVALIFTASVGGRQVQGLDLLRFDDSGNVSELTVMVRPLSGLNALAEAMAPRVADLVKGK